MAEKPVCLFVGYYGAGNLGDELLLQVLGRWAREVGWDVYALSHDTTGSALSHPDFKFIPYGDLELLFDTVRKSRVVLMGGGGPLHEYNRLNPIDLWSFPGSETGTYVQPLILARECGLPVVLLAQGVGPLFSEGAKGVVRGLFETADLVSVRSDEALSILRTIGVQRGVCVYPDPGWVAVANSIDPAEGHPLLVLEVRTWAFENDWHWRLAVATLRIFIEHGWRIRYCCFGGAADAAQAQIVASLYGDPSPEIVLGELGDPAAPFRGAHRAITMRFHAGMTAVGVGVPTCLLAYDGKVAALHRQLGLSEDSQLPVDAPEERFIKVLTALRDTPGPIVDQTNIASLRQSALGHRDILRVALARYHNSTPLVSPEDTAYGRAWSALAKGTLARNIL